MILHRVNNIKIYTCVINLNRVLSLNCLVIIVSLLIDALQPRHIDKCGHTDIS